MKRYLVITGDDFGFSAERNKGIMEAFQNGAIKSASLLLNCTGTDDAASLFKSSSLCPGLHLNLTEGKPISSTPYKTLTDSTGIFHGMINTPKLIGEGKIDRDEIKEEIEAQIARYKQLMGDKPVYVDGHQHVHVLPGVADIFADALQRNNIHITRYPVEVNMSSKQWVTEFMPFFTKMISNAEKAKSVFESHGIRTTDTFTGLSTMGANMTKERLQQIILEAFQDAETKTAGEQDRKFVTCELMTHPGHPTNESYGGFSWGSDDFGLSNDRIHEITVLSSADMMDFYKKNNIEVVSHEILLQ